MIEPRDALAALREAWHEEDQAEAQMSVADYDGEKRTAERRLTAARAAAREAEAAVGVHLGDEGRKATVEDRLAALLADLRKTNDHGQNPQLGEAADHVEAALELVRVWALGIVL